MGFDKDFQLYMQDNIDYNNPLHRGIIIGLLTYSKYSPMSPFWPLQNYGEEKMQQVDKETKKWGDFIIKSLEIKQQNLKKTIKRKKKKKKKKNLEKTKKIKKLKN